MAIIKCPECNHEVSSLAPTCPTCGVQIANNLTECPDCGKNLLKETTECPNCHCILKAQIPVIKKNNYREYPEQKYTPPKSYKTLWTIIATVILIAVIGTGGYLWYTYKMNRQQMLADYQELKQTSSINLCEKFIQDYPESDYTAEVNELLVKFREIRNEWNKIDSSVQQDDYVHFMQQHPGSSYEKDCLTRIDSLDWAATLMTNTPQAYQNYLSNHSDGKYAQIAQKWNTLEAEEVPYDMKAKIATAIKQIHLAISFNKQDSLIYLTTPNMLTQISNQTDQIHKENKYAFLYLNTSIKVSKVPGIVSPFLYLVTYRFTQYLISNAGETIKKPYNATTLFTPDIRIAAINSTEAPYVYTEENNE